MNICTVAGVRSNFVEVAPITRAIQKATDAGRSTSYQLVYVSEEDDPTLERSPFEDLQMPYPDTYLSVDCEDLNQPTGLVTAGLEHYLQTQLTDVVTVVDDSASMLITAIVTKKQGITLAHLVAGTRSFDINMPKEISRLAIDGLNDLLPTAGMGSNNAATREGVELLKICMMSDTLIDTLCLNHSRLRCPAVLGELGVRGGNYIVFTLNRKALLADKANLKNMLHAMFGEVGDKTVLAPLRSRPIAVAAELLGANHPTFKPIKPFSYLQFGYLTAHTCGIITGNGNVAEEATFNNIPCITSNSYTEYVEMVKAGSNVLVDEDAHLLDKTVEDMANGMWKECVIPDRWDERSTEYIV